METNEVEAKAGRLIEAIRGTAMTRIVIPKSQMALSKATTMNKFLLLSKT